MSDTIRKFENVLALETSTEHLVLGWLGVNPGEQRVLLGRAHAEVATRYLATFLQDRSKPDLVAIGAGPGSYTGVRVAASLGLGLARAWDVPIVRVSTLAAMAASRSGLVAVSVNALRGNVYSAVFENLKPIVPIAKRSREAFLELIPDGAIHLENAPISGLALAQLALLPEHQSVMLYL
ncbi:MAG: tRNA (adenosine(37)-N6)-threonylcarbamoyltransferase complex dimerization subunit type 1 TsaB [Deinococcales bacterium]